jgi:hypothetical protein
MAAALVLKAEEEFASADLMAVMVIPVEPSFAYFASFGRASEGEYRNV